ncbi:four helix bundle protein [Halanaerobaculum tunisiense]
MNKRENVIYDKSFDFSVAIVKLCRYLFDEKNEYVLGKQLMRCGTSIGANVREAIEGQSKKDFIAKLSISLKEAGETEYWLNLLIASDVLKETRVNSLLNDVKEIIRILNSILKTARQNS